FFFIQAEDGIRDLIVTGVQTCALPISRSSVRSPPAEFWPTLKPMQGTMLWFNADKGFGFIQTEDDERLLVSSSGFAADHQPPPRSEERRVGKEWKARAAR